MREEEVAGRQHRAFPEGMVALWCFFLADNVQATAPHLVKQP